MPQDIISTVTLGIQTAGSMRYTYLLFCLSLIALSCSRNDKAVWMTCPQTDSDITIEKIDIQKTILDSVYTSYSGYSGLFGDKLYFYDKFFAYLYQFDIDGKLAGKKLGLGRGPGEIPIKNALLCAIADNGDICVSGAALDFAKYSSSSQKTEYIRLSYEADMNTVNPDNFMNYSLNAYNCQALLKGDELYVNVFIEHPHYNPFNGADGFIENACRIGVINLKNKTTRMTVKGFPAIYHKDSKKYNTFDMVNFTGDKSGLLVNFEADSTIYRCNIEGYPKQAFGRSGRGMDNDYKPIYGITDESVANYPVNRSEKGSYGKLAAHGDFVLRSYTRGISTQSDGLQIYDKDILVADLDVPKGFKPAGIIGNKVISEIIADDESGVLYFYSFEL